MEMTCSKRIVSLVLLTCFCNLIFNNGCENENEGITSPNENDPTASYPTYNNNVITNKSDADGKLNLKSNTIYSDTTVIYEIKLVRAGGQPLKDISMDYCEINGNAVINFYDSQHKYQRAMVYGKPLDLKRFFRKNVNSSDDMQVDVKSVEQKGAIVLLTIGIVLTLGLITYHEINFILNAYKIQNFYISDQVEAGKDYIAYCKTFEEIADLMRARYSLTMNLSGIIVSFVTVGALGLPVNAYEITSNLAHASAEVIRDDLVKAAMKEWGKTANDILGRRVSVRVFPIEQSKFASNLRNLYATYQIILDDPICNTELNVIQPNASTKWTQGQTNVPIRWDTGNLGGSVSIVLYQGSALAATIASSTTNDGSHDTYDVPSNLTVGTNYRVRITSTSNAAKYDYSDYFSVQAASSNIQVTQPNASTRWTQGQTNVPIRWDTGNLGGSVSIVLYRGSALAATIASSTTNDGSHDTYDVPSNLTVGTNYRVRITSTSNAAKYDYSDYFEVSAGGTNSEFTVKITNFNFSNGTTAISVASGATVSGTISYQLWNRTTCPACIAQIVIGIENDAQICAYNGIPGVYPGKSGTASVTLKAPTTSGVYNVKYLGTLQYNCTDAQAIYEQAPPSSANKLGSITVAGSASINVTEPNASTKWAQGQANVPIRWDTGNLGGSVSIVLYRGSTLAATIASSTTNDGSHDTYDVPSNMTVGTNYRVKITSTSNATKYDYSDYFEVRAPFTLPKFTNATGSVSNLQLFQNNIYYADVSLSASVSNYQSADKVTAFIFSTTKTMNHDGNGNYSISANRVLIAKDNINGQYEVLLFLYYNGSIIEEKLLDLF